MNVFQLQNFKDILENNVYRELLVIDNHKSTSITILTVIIGSSGPKISSVIIAASSGGSNKIIGSMNLKNVSFAFDLKTRDEILIILLERSITALLPK